MSVAVANIWDEEAHFRRDAKEGSARLLYALTGRVTEGLVLQSPRPRDIGRLSPVAELQKVAAEYLGQPLRHMTDGEPSLPAVQARQIAMYLAVVHLGKNKSEVARRFNVDRTTVYHAVQRVCRKDAMWQKAMAIKALLPVKTQEQKEAA